MPLNYKRRGPKYFLVWNVPVLFDVPGAFSRLLSEEDILLFGEAEPQSTLKAVQWLGCRRRVQNVLGSTNDAVKNPPSILEVHARKIYWVQKFLLW